MSLYIKKSKQECFKEALVLFDQIDFTRRETDILACLVARKLPKKIATLLEIAPKTVSAHLYNIMSKINIHSREQVIELLEVSKLYPYLKKRYVMLEAESELNQSLKELAKMHEQKITCVMDGSLQEEAVQKLLKKLKMAGIFAQHRNKSKVPHPDVRIIFTADHHFVILQGQQQTSVSSHNLLAVFDVIAAILPVQPVRQFIKELKADWSEIGKEK